MPRFEGEPLEQQTGGGRFGGRPLEQPEQDSGDTTLEDAGFLNRGIANVFGMPVDLVASGLRTVGFDPGEAPIGGSKSIESGMRALGVNVPEEGETADEPMEVFFREIGGGVGSLLPFGVVGRAAQGARAAGRGGAITRSMAEGAELAARRPVTSMAAEGAGMVGAGAGAAGGRKLAEETGQDDNAQSLEVIGALAGGLSPAVLASAPSMVKMGAKAGRAAVDPFTKQGSRFRAAKRAQGLAADADDAAQRLQQTDELLPEAQRVVPPAQRTGEKRLVGLQRSLADEDPELDQALSARNERAGQIAREAAGDIGGAPQESARQFLGQRRNQAVERFQDRARKAVARAQNRMGRIEGDITPEQESRIVREELERAEKAAREAERSLYNQVPENVPVSAQTTKRTINQLKMEQSKVADPEDLPTFVVDSSDKLEDQEPVKVLQTLRSRILRAMREERAKDAPNRAKIANMERIQSSILEDMGAAPENVRGEVGEKLREALNFSRVLNERFTQGPVGRVLGYERRGGAAVDPSETLSRTIGRGRERGGAELDAILRASGAADDVDAENAALNAAIRASADSEESRNAINRFLQANFRMQAVNPDNTVSPSAANQFMRRNREVLDRFPELRNRIQRAADAQTQAERATAQAERMTRNLANKSRSRLALYLDTAPDRAMKRVIESDDPAQAAKQLVRTASKDETGMAKRGLKDEFVGQLFREAETGNVDDAGERLISGRRLKRLLDNTQVQKVAKEFMKPEERKRLRQIANTLSAVESSRDKIPNIGKPMEDLASSILEVPSRILGAQIGSRMSQGSGAGGTLQTAQIMSSRVRNMLRSKFRDKAREVLSNAVQDEDLFRTLLTQPTSRQKVKRIENRLNAWLGAPAAQMGGREDNGRQASGG